MFSDTRLVFSVPFESNIFHKKKLKPTPKIKYQLGTQTAPQRESKMAL